MTDNQVIISNYNSPAIGYLLAIVLVVIAIVFIYQAWKSYIIGNRYKAQCNDLKRDLKVWGD